MFQLRFLHCFDGVFLIVPVTICDIINQGCMMLFSFTDNVSGAPFQAVVLPHLTDPESHCEN